VNKNRFPAWCSDCPAASIRAHRAVAVTRWVQARALRDDAFALHLEGQSGRCAPVAKLLA